MKSIKQYFKRDKPFSLREALDDCLLANTERGKAFLYKKYYGYVMAVVLRYIAQEMDAEEAVNETFVKVFRKLESFERHPDEEILEKTFKSWMARIAVNTSIDLLRTKSKPIFLKITTKRM